MYHLSNLTGSFLLVDCLPAAPSSSLIKNLDSGIGWNRLPLPCVSQVSILPCVYFCLVLRLLLSLLAPYDTTLTALINSSRTGLGRWQVLASILAAQSQSESLRMDILGCIFNDCFVSSCPTLVTSSHRPLLASLLSADGGGCGFGASSGASQRSRHQPPSPPPPPCPHTTYLSALHQTLYLIIPSLSFFRLLNAHNPRHLARRFTSVLLLLFSPDTTLIPSLFIDRPT